MPGIVTEMLKKILVEAFQYQYQYWELRLRRCIVVQGNYFGKSKITLITFLPHLVSIFYLLRKIYIKT